MTELAQPSDNTSLHPSELAAASAALTSRASVPDSIDPIDSIASHEGFQGATEADVAYWAASVRTAFGRNREQFNFAICDALATAGVTPTAASVLRVGKWGHHTSVASDVSAWLSQLTQRFVELQAGVPLPARKLANDLIEKLFSLSQLEAEKEVQLRMDPLEKKISNLSEALEAEQLQVDDMKAQDLASKAQIEQLQSQLNTTVLTASEERNIAKGHAALLQSTVDRLSSDLLAEAAAGLAIAQANAKVHAQLQQDLVNMQAASTQALQKSRTEHDAERRRLMLQLDDQRTAERQTVNELRTEISGLSAKLDALRQKQESTNIAQAREAALHESALLSWNKDRLQLERLNSQMNSPDAKNANVLTLSMIYPKLGITITRNADVDVVAMLVRDLGMTSAMAEKIMLNIPQVEMAAKKASSQRD